MCNLQNRRFACFLLSSEREDHPCLTDSGTKNKSSLELIIPERKFAFFSGSEVTEELRKMLNEQTM